MRISSIGYIFLYLFGTSPVMAATCTLVDVLPVIRPGSEWTVTDNTLTWLDQTQTRPSAGEISSGIAVCTDLLTLREADLKQARKDVKDQTQDDHKRLNALIKILQLDK